MPAGKRFGPFLPVEKALSAYLIMTFVFIVLFSGRLSGEAPHLIYRIIILGLIAFFPYLEEIYCRSALVRWIRIFFPFLVLSFFYAETDYLNNVLFSRNFDPEISGLESMIFGFQPSLRFSAVLQNRFFADLMYFGYFSYYLMAIGIPLYIYFRVNRDNGERFAFIIISSFLLYYLIFIVFPVAGPQFFFRDTPVELPQGMIFGKVIRLIQGAGEGETAAFPSSHVSICLMLLWGCFRYAGKLLPYVLPLACILMFSTVYLRAHYVVDVLAGVLFTPILWMSSSMLYKLLGMITKTIGIKPVKI